MPLDLVDQIGVIEKAEEVARVVGEMKAITQKVDDDMMLSVCRDLMIEEISQMIYKFPVPIQKELLALLVDRHLTEWQDNGVN